MEVLLEDIARTLNATFITLPGSPDESIPFGMPPQSGSPESPDARHRAPLRVSEQLPVGIGRLNIDLDDPRGISGPVPTSRALRGSGNTTTAAPYRGMPPPPLLPPRGLERPLA